MNPLGAWGPANLQNDMIQPRPERGRCARSRPQSVPKRCPLPHRCWACRSSAARPAAVAVEVDLAVLVLDLPVAPEEAGLEVVPPDRRAPAPPKPEVQLALDDDDDGAANEEGTAGPLPRRLMSNWGGASRDRTSAGGGEPPAEGQICTGGARRASR